MLAALGGLAWLWWRDRDRLGAQLTRARRALAVQQAELERLRRADPAILEHLPDPLIVLGPDRAALRSNGAARRMLGGELPAALRHPGLRGAIDRAFAEGGGQEADISLAVPVARDLRAHVVMLDPPLADGGRALVVLSDRSAERALARMRADFVANASHELRTPLASLIGFVETLQGPAADDPPAQARFLAIMAEQGARMNRLIDDLLSLSRIEMTEHQPPVEKVALGPLLARVVAGFEPRLAERGARVAMEVTTDLPTVFGDPDQLTQVWQNLLDNALKYGRDQGLIRLSARIADGDGKAPEVVVSVRDDGIGIARENLPRLTERFYRVDAGRSRAVGGTGLGLAIVKHIVNRHRGRLVIESEPGAGTNVMVCLPVAF